MFKILFLIASLQSVSAFGQLSARYPTASAIDKQAMLWHNLAATTYEQLPAMIFFPEDRFKVVHGVRVGSAAVQLGKAFDHVSDEMPAGRVKIIHAYGSAAKIEFVPAPQHPFSGLFRSGAIGVARLSLGVPHGTTGTFVPGLAIKLLVDGGPSKNMHVMQRLEGQDDNRDFFKYTFTNKLPEPTTTSTKMGKKYFGRFVENPIFLRVDHVASVTKVGEPVEKVLAPYQIFFQPADGLHLDETAADFRIELAKIPVGTKLYDVYGTMNEFTQTPIYLGSVILRSVFLASEYGDKKLYFQHEGTPRRSFWLGRRLGGR